MAFGDICPEEFVEIPGGGSCLSLTDYNRLIDMLHAIMGRINATLTATGVIDACEPIAVDGSGGVEQLTGALTGAECALGLSQGDIGVGETEPNVILSGPGCTDVDTAAGGCFIEYDGAGGIVSSPTTSATTMGIYLGPAPGGACGDSSVIIIPGLSSATACSVGGGTGVGVGPIDIFTGTTLAGGCDILNFATLEEGVGIDITQAVDGTITITNTASAACTPLARVTDVSTAGVGFVLNEAIADPGNPGCNFANICGIRDVSGCLTLVKNVATNTVDVDFNGIACCVPRIYIGNFANTVTPTGVFTQQVLPITFVTDGCTTGLTRVGNTIVIGEAGYYSIGGSVSVQNGQFPGVTYSLDTSIFLNGVQAGRASGFVNDGLANGNSLMQVQWEFQLFIGDVLDLRVLHNAGGNLTMGISALWAHKANKLDEICPNIC